MDVVNVHEAKTHLSRLLDRVEQGEEILLARNGKPVAKLSPAGAAERVPGRLKGQIHMTAEFDDPLPEDLRVAFAIEG
ncbi:MAG: type II toxin-antitoxin system Phd/YefM family antitoxin [Actinomycetota bacterium]